MPLPSLSLVLGGAASGKSRFAEGLVTGSGAGPVYVATAQARDAEMAARISAHRAGRAAAGWRTVEEPLDLPRVLAGIAPHEAALIDCATLWLTNLMLSDADIPAAEAALWPALSACAGPVVVVTNEVGQGIVPETPLGRRFRDAQGGLNQRLASRAGLVVAVMAGLPLTLKGAMP